MSALLLARHPSVISKVKRHVVKKDQNSIGCLAFTGIIKLSKQPGTFCGRKQKYTTSDVWQRLALH